MERNGTMGFCFDLETRCDNIELLPELNSGRGKVFFCKKPLHVGDRAEKKHGNKLGTKT